MNTTELIARPKYAEKFSRLWERYDEACHGNAQQMRDILEITLDALETAERHIFKTDRDYLALVEALESAQSQSSKWLEAYHKAVSIGARYEERIAELEARTVTLPEPIRAVALGRDFPALQHSAVVTLLREAGIKCEVKGS
nr:MAG TPA: hypothetical protein [Caudoviricetes sp.]